MFRSLTLLRLAGPCTPASSTPTTTGLPSTKLATLRGPDWTSVIAGATARWCSASSLPSCGKVAAADGSRRIGYAYLDGRTRNRPASRRWFQRGNGTSFLISLKAGGLGLNLTEADYVFLLDPWWNPAAERRPSTAPIG